MLLTLKLLLVPLFIALVSVAGRIWGHKIGGRLAGLPIIAGPIVVFLAAEHGIDFGVASSKAALAGVASIACFCFCYAHGSQHRGVIPSLAIGVSGFGLVTSILAASEFTLPITALVSIATLVGFILMFPAHPITQTKALTPNREIFIRMLASAALVITITYSADSLGARLSGLLAPFPIAGTILAGFTHANSGGDAARQLLAGFLQGLFSMAAFFFVLAYVLPAVGIWLSVTLAITSALIASSLLPALNLHFQFRR